MSISWQNKAGPRYLGINSGYIPPSALPQGLLSPSECCPVLGRATRVSVGSVESQGTRLCHSVVSFNHSSDCCSGQHCFPLSQGHQPNLWWQIMGCLPAWLKMLLLPKEIFGQPSLTCLVCFLPAPGSLHGSMYATNRAPVQQVNFQALAIITEPLEASAASPLWLVAMDC